MNKKLISKCCHKYVIEQWFCGKRNYVCSGCNNQDCEVIEEPTPQPIQKEEEDKGNVDNLSRAELYAKGYQDGVNAIEKDFDIFNEDEINI